MKVLLVDDEVILLDSLESMIDWDAHNIELIGKVTNAQEALSICEKIQPDLVITDIKMRNMDGLELTKELGLRYPTTKVIIMSSYDEFAYAKKAIELRVSNYLLKIQTDKLEFLKAVLQVKSEIEITNAANEPQAEKELIAKTRKFFQGECDVSGLNSTMQNFISNTKPDFSWIMIGIYFDDIAMTIQEYFSDIALVVQQLFPNTLATEYKNIFYLCLPINKNMPYKNIVNRLKSQLSILLSPCSVGVSKEFAIEDIKDGFWQAQTAAKNIFYAGQNCSVYWEELKPPAKHQEYEPTPYEYFYSDISSGNYIAITQKLTEIFERCVTEATYSSNQMFRLVEHILLSLSHRESMNAQQELIKTKLSFFKVTKSFEEFTKGTFAVLEEMQCLDHFGNTSSIVTSSIQFILTNYQETISLNEIAEFVKVSPAYLSKLFKKETGLNITAYIQNVKIKYAQQMLVEDSMNVIEIANHLGFDSSSYFSSIFQKHMGCSPTEFRKAHR